MPQPKSYSTPLSWVSEIRPGDKNRQSAGIVHSLRSQITAQEQAYYQQQPPEDGNDNFLATWSALRIY